MSRSDEPESKIDGIIRKCVDKWYESVESDTNKPTIVDVFKILKVNGLLPLMATKDKKSNEESGKLREAGNQSYKAKEFEEALRKYTRAICCAQEEDEPMALAFANRSAVHYELQAYDDVINDVSHSLATGKYPERLKHKLFERRAKSYLRLSLYEKALDDSKKVVSYLTNVDLNKIDDHLADKDKEKVVSLLVNGDSDKEKAARLKSLVEIMSECVGKKDQPRTTVKERKLSHKQSKDGKTAYPAMDIAVSPDMGTHVVATANISPGDILAVEKPAVSVLTPEFRLNFCDHCKRRSRSSVPCGNCNAVVFCSDECQKTAWESHHSLECDLLPTVIDLGCKVNVIIAVRAFLKATKCGNDLRRFAQEQSSQANPACNHKRKKGKTPRTVILHPGDYRSYHYLVTNEESRSVVQIIGTLTTAACIVHIMKNATKFFDKFYSADDVQGPLKLEHVVTANLISRYFMAAGCNAFEIGESIFTPRADHVDYEFRIIGGALYPTYCLLNHSCDPDVSTYMPDEETRVLYAIKPIRKGQQIFISYGPEYIFHDRRQRQNDLLSKYFFTCNCPACQGDWPTAEDLPEYPKFVSLKAQTTNGPMVYETCKKLPEIVLAADKGPITRDQLQTTIQFLSLYDKYVIKPWKYYFAAQRVIRRHFNYPQSQ